MTDATSPATGYLTHILEHKRNEVAASRREHPLAMLQDAVDYPVPTRGFARALRGEQIRVIAEVKRASPSRGVMAVEFDPVLLGKQYLAGGAAALSVLTDERFFQGSNLYLEQVRAAIPLPVLRKDFVVDPYQVWESAAMGADAVLLIVAALDDAQLGELLGLATMLGLDALVEVHDSGELERALRVGAHNVGINNRDLHTFHTDLSTTQRLAAAVGDGVTLVSESGIRTRADVEVLRDAGVDAVLIGEALVIAEDRVGLLAELASVPARAEKRA
jgi:indole-3-glycerol phosphate synthase